MGKEYLYEVGEIINGLQIISQTRKNKKKGSIKAYEVQSIAYPEAPHYVASEYDLKYGRGDAYACSQRIFEGNSLWSIEEIRKNIIDIEEAKTLAPKTTKKIMFKCDVCGKEKNMMVYDIIRYGFSCDICSSNVSYPELFFQAYLEVKGINYEYQVSFNDTRRKIDFYIPSMDIYVEVHGIVHYKKQHVSAWTNSYDNTLKSDNIKRKWCEDNNKKLVELDCRESSFKFIKNSIDNNKELPNILEDEVCKIEDIIKQNKTHDTENIIKMYESGLSYMSIAKKLGMGDSLVYNILKRNNTKMRDVNETRKKKVQCVETGEIFKSVAEASEKLGINKGNLARVCRERKGTVGGYHWIYV